MHSTVVTYLRMCPLITSQLAFSAEPNMELADFKQKSSVVNGLIWKTSLMNDK